MQMSVEQTQSIAQAFSYTARRSSRVKNPINGSLIHGGEGA